MSDNNSCVLIGLPRSGKSTFIAALWNTIESGEIDSSLIVNALPKDRTYLNELRDQWLNFYDLDRTKVDFIKKISFQIKKTDSNEFLLFDFPDVSGEMFDLQFETRKMQKEFSSILENSNSVIVFINPDLVKKPTLISDLIPIPKDSDELDKTTSWDYKDVPTQVILVDLLQMIHLKINRPIKVGIIISAWDKIKNSKDEDFRIQTPLTWISNQLPLLEQFLQTNDDIFRFKCFGVSAQGGDYKSDIDGLSEFILPSQRIIVQDGSDINNDITLPIRWLINE